MRSLATILLTTALVILAGTGLSEAPKDAAGRPVLPEGDPATSSLGWLRSDKELPDQILELTFSAVSRYHAGLSEARLKMQQLPERGLVAMSDEELVSWLCNNTDFLPQAMLYHPVSQSSSGYGPDYRRSALASTKRFDAAKALLDRPSAGASLVCEMSSLDKKQVLMDVCGIGGYQKQNRFMTLLFLMYAKLATANAQERQRMFDAVLAQYEVVVVTGVVNEGGGFLQIACQFLGDIMRDAEFDEYIDWRKSVRAVFPQKGLDKDLEERLVELVNKGASHEDIMRVAERFQRVDASRSVNSAVPSREEEWATGYLRIAKDFSSSSTNR